MVAIVPSTETDEFYEDAFLPDSSSNLFDNLDVSSSVPLIIGTDKDEGMMMLLCMYIFIIFKCNCWDLSLFES